MREKTKVAIYIRVGNKSQLGLVEIQKEITRSYAAEKGYEVVAIYQDIGFSGTSLERPELKKLISAAEKNEFDAVVVSKLDRISRDITHTSKLIEILEGNNIGFESAQENIGITKLKLLLKLNNETK